MSLLSRLHPKLQTEIVVMPGVVVGRDPANHPHFRQGLRRWSGIPMDPKPQPSIEPELLTHRHR